MTPGRDYSLAAISIDPQEMSADAKAAKADDAHRYGVLGAEAHWHFLTGQADAVRAISDAVGPQPVRCRDAAVHASCGYCILNAIRQDLQLFAGRWISAVRRLAVTRAKKESPPAAAQPVLLLCFHYDPTTGRYTLAIMKLLRLVAIL